MGPHSFKCGSCAAEPVSSGKKPRFNGAALFQVRKSRRFAIDHPNVDQLQWGRTLSSAEVRPLSASRAPACNASMGPHSFKCGSVHCLRLVRTGLPCFNGAALFQVRKSGIIWRVSPGNSLLQWGRTLSSAEVDDLRLTPKQCNAASMGPHSFKCGSHAAEPAKRRASSALQWGRTLSSAEVGVAVEVSFG